MSVIHIRPIADREWARVREICCRTARSGEPIEETRWPFFGELWGRPYEWFAPQWTFVAEAQSEIVGYITGCPNTARFEWMKRIFFHPVLLFKIHASKKFPSNSDTARFTKRVLGQEADPNDSFTEAALRTIRGDFPAHLHVNVLTGFRKEGLGARLVSRLFEELRKQEIRGLHLFCGPAPVAFYERQGMEIIEKIEYKPGVFIYALGIRL